MRTCRSCGRESPDDADFCACGEYLRWEPTNFVPAAAAPASAPASGQAGGLPATAPEDLDPNVTLAAEVAAPGAGWGPRLGDGRPAPGLPGSGDAPPGAAALMLRLPEDDGAAEGVVSVSVEPGQQVMILGLIRNQSEVVDNFDLSIRNLPKDWWTITPATAYLVPYGAGGTYEQEFQVHVHPPRTPEAQARMWAFEVVATSRAYGGEVAAAPASVTIGPYFDVATELRPERGSGRLKARYRLIVRNRANARTEVALSAEDTDGKCQFRFAAPSIALDPGGAMECPFTIFPPSQIWIGKPVDWRFQVTAAPIGVDVVQPPRMAVFRQRSWLPWWLAIVIPIVVVAVILILMLMPKQGVVPNVKGQPSVFQATKLLTAAGFVVAPKHIYVLAPSAKQVGSIADQTPKAGTKAKKGTPVVLEVYKGTGKVAVPSVVGLTLGLASQKLLASQLQLGAVTPQPPNPTAKIVSQVPPQGTPVANGTAVQVFLPQSGPTGGTGATAGTGASGATAGTGASGASGPTAGTGASGSSGASGASGASTSTGASGASGPSASTGASGSSGASGSTGTGGLGAVSITIPRLSGSPAQAASELSKLGLKPVRVVRIAPVAAGQLAAVIPAAGSAVKKGATVRLVVSSGTPQLAYDDGQTIHVINSATLKPSGTVAAATAPAVEAAWSPDGTHIIYSQNGQLVLDQPNVAKAVPFQVTAPQAGVSYFNPSFAPTLRSPAPIVAFIARSATTAQLCFGTIQKVALTPSCASAPGWDLGGQVEWSPDGTKILVLGSQNGGNTFGLIEFTSKVPFSTQASDWGTGTPVTQTSTAGQGVFAGAFSPDGKQLALVSNVGTSGFFLYIVPASDFKPTPAQQLPVPACEIAWRSDGRELAVMQPSNGPCSPSATGTIIGVKPAHPHRAIVLATQAANPSWQPIPASG